MDGYSVHDAATVLGIPEARVWELIARGVLAGNPEADGAMRVYLKTAAPVTPTGPRDEPKPNGNGNGHGLDPFRELLTEFRNLTERYGQALLALGEARGEVASLRSRIEVLETRIDLRLPGTRPTSTVAWEMPDLPAPAAVPRAPRREPDGEASAAPEVDAPEAAPETSPAMQPVAEVSAEAAEDLDDVVHAADASSVPDAPLWDAEDEAEPPEAEPPEAEPRPPETEDRPGRARSGRTLTGNFAEALARAQDPTLSNLPGGQEAAEAMAAFQQELTAADDTDDHAEVETAAVEPDSSEPTFVEPMTASTPTLADLVDEAPAPMSPPQPEIDAGPAPSPSAEAEPAAGVPSPYSTEIVEPDWFADGDFAWPGPQAPSPEVAPPDPEAQRQSAVMVDDLTDDAAEDEEAAAQPVPSEAPFEPATVAVATAVPIEPPASPPDAAPPADQPADREVRGAEGDEVELMWLGDEFEASGLEQAASGWHPPGRSTDAEVRRTGSAMEDASGSRTELSDAQLEQLAEDEGWDPTEVDAIRAFLGRSGSGGSETAGSVEATPPTSVPGPDDVHPLAEEPPSAPPSEAAPPRDSVEGPKDSPPPPTSLPPLPFMGVTVPSPRPAPGDPDWLRGRRGSAATAYRRLRRLFPG